MIRYAIYGVRLCIARQLAKVRLHQWNLDCLNRDLQKSGPDSSSQWIRKKRTRLSELMIPPGNFYLSLQGATSRILSCQKWMAWETAIAQELGRVLRVSRNGRCLEFPRLPGQSLHELLRSNLPLNEKLRGIFLAADALRKLHQVTVTSAETGIWPLSHGDATCWNVVVNLAGNTADWIDFDMRHRTARTHLTRRADDLRALLCSSAAALNRATYRDCVREIWNGYAEDNVTREVQSLFRKTNVPTVFELAQAPLTAAEFHDLGTECLTQLTFRP